MCGLTGVLVGENPREAGMKEIGELFTASLLANEERGREATGVASIDGHGAIGVKKGPQPASQFVKTESYSAFMENVENNEISVLLGHTRRPTKGSPRENDNNHPIRVGDTVGIHNGTITNDDEIFLSMEKRQSKKRKRIGSVDSEAIFALMEEVDLMEPFEKWADGIKTVASLLVGSYTTLFFNKALPHMLFLLKYDNPISVHYCPDLNALFFSSRYVFLRKAFGRSVITEALPSKTGYVYDATVLKQKQKEPAIQFGLSQLKKQYPCSEKRAE